MQDSKKTKAQLIEELAELKNRLAELTGEPSDETTETTETTDSHPRSTRNEIKTAIQLIGDFGLVEAKGLDLSDSGIGFELEDDIPFDMEFEVDGDLHQHRAHMVWMQRLDNGRNRFGFQFIAAPTSSLLWLYKELGGDSK
jgi:hypothetical protein